MCHIWCWWILVMRFLSEEDYGHCPFWQLSAEWSGIEAICLQMLICLLPWQHQSLSLWLLPGMQHLVPAPICCTDCSICLYLSFRASSLDSLSSAHPLLLLSDCNICHYPFSLFVHNFRCLSVPATLSGYWTQTFFYLWKAVSLKMFSLVRLSVPDIWIISLATSNLPL